jgi:Rrf2 family protein
MLRVSTRGEYGVRLLVDLARHHGEKPRSLTEISQAEGLELKLQYLEQLVKCLREHDLVESTRGAHGGYRLSRPPEQIHMGEVVRALEGQIAPMICATEGEMEVICDRLDGCSTRYLWNRLRDAISATLDSISLADLVREARLGQELPLIMPSTIVRAPTSARQPGATTVVATPLPS